MINTNLKIIAGPCSINKENIDEIKEISQIEINKQKAIFGTRVVGLKSRTTNTKNEKDLGMDYKVFMKNLNKLKEGKTLQDLIEPPSVKYIKEIISKTHLIVATEIMDPLLQLPCLEKEELKGKIMPWNPSVNQLGWPLLIMSTFCNKNNWPIGIKNAKWLGDKTSKAENKGKNTHVPLEKIWNGLASYAELAPSIILIQRGVDVPEKGNYRNLPIHETAKRTKIANPKVQLYFDPSHSYGPKMRNSIVEKTTEAMKIKIDDDKFLYDGILIEAGTSKTDTEQHITIDELKILTKEISKTRRLTI